MFPPPPQCSVPARYARLHYALGGGGKETKPTTNILLKVPNLFQDLTICRKSGLHDEAPRRLDWPKVSPRESPMTARRLSHDSPVCLARSDNRFGLCNWGPSDVSQKKTLYHLQIQRAAHPQSRSGHYVRVNLRHAHVHMAEQILERADLRAGKQGTNFERPTLNIERRTGLLTSEERRVR